MTTIYIITEGDYSDYHIEAVCSSLEKCQEWMMSELKRRLKSEKKWLARDELELSKPYEQRAQDITTSNRAHFLEQYYTDEKLYENIGRYKSNIRDLEKQIEKGSWIEQSEGYDGYTMREYRVEEYIVDRIQEAD